VIRPEQLAAAIERLDPRAGALLTLSLKRRVPDEALARVYEIEPSEVVRRRSAAIERLADERQNATNDLSSIGRPVSFGCMRTDARRAQWPIETIPLGAPIFIRS
jgi:hypothetical protein